VPVQVVPVSFQRQACVASAVLHSHGVVSSQPRSPAYAHALLQLVVQLPALQIGVNPVQSVPAIFSLHASPSPASPHV
jgi:hypothetical protein